VAAADERRIRRAAAAGSKETAAGGGGGFIDTFIKDPAKKRKLFEARGGVLQQAAGRRVSCAAAQEAAVSATHRSTSVGLRSSIVGICTS
jgi:hypothetical protein